jgi:hypothetical protein
MDYSQYYGAQSNTLHVMHHSDHTPITPTINVKAEKNTKGYNYEASVSGCGSVEQAMTLLDTVMQSLQRTYGAPQTA